MSVGDILPGIMVECGLDVMSPDIASNDFQMRQIAGMMNAAGKDINTRAQWPRTLKDVSVPGDISNVALQGDFQEMAVGGAVQLNKSTFQPVRSTQHLALGQFLLGNPPSVPYYMLYSGRIYFSPQLDSDGAEYRYVSRNWVSGNKPKVTANGDEILFPEDLLARGTVWRWRRQKGLPFEDLMAEFEADLEAAIIAEKGA